MAKNLLGRSFVNLCQMQSIPLGLSMHKYCHSHIIKKVPLHVSSSVSNTGIISLLIFQKIHPPISLNKVEESEVSLDEGFYRATIIRSERAAI